MPNETATNPRVWKRPPEKCHERTHMRPSVFMTYHPIVAMAKSNKNWKPGMPLIFHGAQTTLANANNRGVDQEVLSINWLLEKGWLVEMKRMGSHGTRRFRVLEHAEYVTKYPDRCPPYRYAPEDSESEGLEKGDKLAPGKKPLDFALYDLLKDKPLHKAIANVLGSLSEQQTQELLKTWPTNPPTVELKLNLSVRGKSRNVGPGKIRSRSGENTLLGPGKTPDKSVGSKVGSEVVLVGREISPTENAAQVVQKTGEGRGTPTPSSNDRPTKPADTASKVQTVAQYFNGVTDSELVYALSNTHITPDDSYPHWLTVVIRCKDVIPKWGGVQVSAKTLANIMGVVMEQCRADKKPDPPREWYVVMKKMRAGEPLLYTPVPEPPPDEPIDEAYTAAWTAFSERPEQLGRSIAERVADFEKEWKP